jgi:hypothetical protein
MAPRRTSVSWLVCKKTVHFQPVHEGTEPAIAGAIRIPEAETVAAILVMGKFVRSAGFDPGVYHAELTAEVKIRGGVTFDPGRGVVW